MADNTHEHSKHAHHEHMNAQHAGHEQMPPQNHRENKNGHAHMVDDFKKRFWISLVLTIPVLLLTPTVQIFGGGGRSRIAKNKT